MPHDPVLDMLLEMLHAVARREVERDALREAGAGHYTLTEAQLQAERVALHGDHIAPIEADEAPTHLTGAIVLDFTER